MSKISIITSFLGLWLTSYLSDNNQIIFGFFLIFTFGILHGANDLVLINQFESKKKTTFCLCWSRGHSGTPSYERLLKL